MNVVGVVGSLCSLLFIKIKCLVVFELVLISFFFNLSVRIKFKLCGFEFRNLFGFYL